MTTLKLTDAIIRASASDKSFARGQELYRNYAISDAAIIRLGQLSGQDSPVH